MVAWFVKKWHEWHKVMMAGSEWLLLEMHTDWEPFCKISCKTSHQFNAANLNWSKVQFQFELSLAQFSPSLFFVILAPPPTNLFLYQPRLIQAWKRMINHKKKLGLSRAFILIFSRFGVFIFGLVDMVGWILFDCIVIFALSQPFQVRFWCCKKQRWSTQPIYNLNAVVLLVRLYWLGKTSLLFGRLAAWLGCLKNLN